MTDCTYWFSGARASGVLVWSQGLSFFLLPFSSDSDPREWVALYGELHGFVEMGGALKAEVSLVLFPVFVHIYLYLVSNSHLSIGEGLLLFGGHSMLSCCCTIMWQCVQSCMYHRKLFLVYCMPLLYCSGVCWYLYKEFLCLVDETVNHHSFSFFLLWFEGWKVNVYVIKFHISDHGLLIIIKFSSVTFNYLRD